MKQKTKVALILSGLIIVLFFTESLNIFFPFTSCSELSKKTDNDTNSVSGKISISGAFALYPLTVKWAEEFKKQNPKVQIDISAGGAGKGMTDVLSDMVDLAMFSREVNQAEFDKGAWNIAVAQDAVFPTVNTSNPEYSTIMQMGLTKEQFKQIFVLEEVNWSHLLNNHSKTQLNVYTRSDACGAAATWAKFMDADQENLLGTGVYGDPGMADAVIKDIYGVGYNNLVYLYNLKTKMSNEGISVIPIDANGNRVIDSEENFYKTLDEVTQAIKEGKYPSPPARKLYLISKGKPENEALNAFLNFVLNQGQTFVSLSGYVELNQQVIESQINKLTSPDNE
ncbi:MAG: substrate-binding domain-containing protein [Salinivirgaceae bacterium]|nr:substrate-binding domain-containing protein [Salinivirgaceae bacterium]